jgi:hypothetical protein
MGALDPDHEASGRAVPASARGATASAGGVTPDHVPGTAADAPPILALAAVLDEEPLFVSRTIRAFIRDGRLVSIPARQRKKRVILRWLRDRLFPDDLEVTESEVNARIATVHPDVAALRRYLVDAGLLDRAAGRYRRRPA